MRSTSIRAPANSRSCSDRHQIQPSRVNDFLTCVKTLGDARVSTGFLAQLFPTQLLQIGCSSRSSIRTMCRVGRTSVQLGIVGYHEDGFVFNRGDR